MSVKEKILEILEKNKNTPVSGQSIADTLGVSRAAVWKAVKSLKDEGYKISAVNNQGYCLSGDSDVLSVPAIKNFLHEDVNVSVLKTVDSTNNYAKRLAMEGAPDKTVVVSETQTAGKGRLGRSFFSPEGTGLYMSVILRPEKSASESIFITVAAAVAVCRAIETVSDISPRIKWVNDIFAGGRKVCGILTEASQSIENQMIEYAVLGIGVNVKNTDFPEDLQGTAGSLGIEKVSRSRLAAEILNELFVLYASEDRKSLMDEYKSRSLVLGKEVRFTKNGKTFSGIAFDINMNGNLLVKTDEGIETLFSGEISIGSENYAK